ncbi:MAG: TetR/AcrR family transcriptional regulator [Desulfobacteraceae bacterium]|jgi:TetR/AcrR family transcriptional regulator
MNAKRIRDPEATKHALLNAAEEIFLEKGYGNASLSEIARKANMTKSLIHHYFGSKVGLWQEVKMRRFSSYMDQQLKMLQDQPATVELLSDSFRLYFHYLKNNPQMVRLLAWIFLERDEDGCLDMDKKLVRIGIEKFTELQAKGKLRDDIDPKFMQFVFIALISHWFQDKEHFIKDYCKDGLPEGEDLDETFMESAAKIFMQGILPR